MKVHNKYIEKTYSPLVNNKTLLSNNPLLFEQDSLKGIYNNHGN